jgi:hypothetical protein
MHLHADAWPLDESKFNKLAEDVSKRNRALAIRGWGVEHRGNKVWVGDVIDQFFMFEANYFDENSVFDFELMDLLPHTSIANGLMILFLGRVGLSNIYHYSDMSDDVDWQEKKKYYGRIRPSVYVPRWKFLHVARDGFPGEYGKHLQAIYLRQNEIEYGSAVKSLLSNYSMSKENLQEELQNIEDDLDRRLRYLGYNPEIFGRRFEYKKGVLDKNKYEKVRSLVRNLLTRKIYYPGLRILNRLTPLGRHLNSKQLYQSTRDVYLGNYFLYPDASWPDESLDGFYAGVCDKADFSDSESFWFENYRPDSK